MQCFILSLPEDTHRRDKLIPQLDALELTDRTIVPGVRVTSMEDIDEKEYNNLEGYHNDRVRSNPDYIKAVVGCKRAWIDLLTQVGTITNNQWVLCLEDDVILPDKEDWENDVLPRIKYIPKDCNVVLLWRHHANMGPIDKHCIAHLPKYGRGMVAYLIKPKFAREVARKLKSFGREADCIWEYYIQKEKKEICSINCCLTSQDDSNIIQNIPELVATKHGLY